tara:strand:- start:240 stop:800 length:561 start_codon:yes stop_codon:yes gene_type:complete
MRIIAGNLRGKKIFYPDDKKTRPLRDMVKESIFNLIENSNKYNLQIDKSNILDLFSGSGSFGLECISRGAKKVFFFENYSEALKVLRKNILELKLSRKCKIFEKNCLNFNEYQKIIDEKFDIIFIDPPFKERKINLLIERVLSREILSDTGIVIIHRHKKDDVIISDKFQTLDIRSYGISKIIIGH